MTQAPTPTTDTVRRLVRSLLKSGAGGSGSRGGGAAGGGDGPEVRPVAEEGGGGPAAWWVGNRHVLRLAPDRPATVRQRRELRLRDLVRPYVGVAVPASVAHGEWGGGLTCTLDTRIAGTTAEVHDVSAVGEADLAGLLTGLREVPPRHAETLGVPRLAPRSLEAVRTAAVRAARGLADADEFDAARLGRLTPANAAQLTASGAVLVHHGLRGEHLVVSADGRVRGVLGWADAVLADPAEDIAALAAVVGAPAAVRAATLAGYGARPCLRGLWLARCDTVTALATAVRDGATAPLPALRARLTRAWEAILLERVTDPRGED